jgi:hypothetical protein
MENNFWKILEAYRKGWNDCFGDKPNYPDDTMLKHAYEIGWADYILGDDVSSIDLQTNKEIVNKIRKSFKNE